MKNSYAIRLIRTSDCKDVLSVYAPYVRNTSVTFDYEVPSHEEFLERIENNRVDYPWLVCLYDNVIVGYAYASKHRYKAAYQWSPESTVYVAEEFHRKGVARVLYTTLFDLIRLQGYCNVFAGITMPNAASEALHTTLGFSRIGDFKNIGFKHGAWHDVRWFQLDLRNSSNAPGTIKTMKEIESMEEFSSIMLRTHD